MLLNFFFLSLALAGMGKIWSKLQKDFPNFKIFIKKLPSLKSHALCCSFCFTFWLSLLFVLLFNPLNNWIPLPRFDISNEWIVVISIFFSWMIIGTGAWIARFIMDELQLLIHYQNHILKEKSGHK